MEQASVPEVLASVERSVLQDILAPDPADDLVVPEGQEPCTALVGHPVVAAAATAAAVCQDPDDPVVAEQLTRSSSSRSRCQVSGLQSY